jgi:glycosyltransferase involved in cell wall biosynthesis
LRIAVVTETFSPFRGGSAKRYLEVFRRLSKKHDVHLYTVRMKDDWAGDEVLEGIQVHRSGVSPKKLITDTGFRSVDTVLRFALWSSERIRRDGPFDLIEANHCPIFPALSSWLQSRMASTPLSVTFHEVWNSEWYRYVPWKLYAPVGITLERATTMIPDMAIAVSDTTANGLVSAFGMNREKIRVISNGVDLDSYGAEGPERDTSKIIFVGRLNPHKKLDWLLSAVKILSDEFPDISLDVVGDGPSASYYRSYAVEEGVSGKVRFLGSLDDHGLIKSLKGAAVYVQPSIREGQSITVLEAMAAGTPQVSIRAAGTAVPELLEASGSGLVVQPTPKSIADGIGQVLKDSALRARLSNSGTNYVKKYSWDEIASEHERAYEELVRLGKNGHNRPT